MKPDPVAMAIVIDVLFVLLFVLSFILASGIGSLRSKVDDSSEATVSKIKELQTRIMELERIAGVDNGDDNSKDKQKNDPYSGFSDNHAKTIAQDYINGRITKDEYVRAILDDTNKLQSNFTYKKTTTFK